jgi:hypothetical protein
MPPRLQDLEDADIQNDAAPSLLELFQADDVRIASH